MADQSVICRALIVYNVLSHYLFNVASLNPSHKLIAHILSSRCLYSPTAITYLKKNREGLNWKLDLSGFVWEVHGHGHQKHM